MDFISEKVSYKESYLLLGVVGVCKEECFWLILEGVCVRELSKFVKEDF